VSHCGAAKADQQDIETQVQRLRTELAAAERRVADLTEEKHAMESNKNSIIQAREEELREKVDEVNRLTAELESVLSENDEKVSHKRGSSEWHGLP
jgi:chromosome segregation ATPase